jgi:Putative adhesin
MKRFLVVLALVATPLAAQNVSIDDGDAGTTNCDQIHIRFDGERAVMATEDVPAASVHALRVDAEQRTAVHVVGWDESGWSIKACKAAASQALLNQIHVALSGGQLTANVPEDAMVFFVVRAPRNASLEVASSSGPVGVYDVNGTLRLRAHNGPLSLKHTSGTIDAATTNGPIDFTGASSGTVKLTAQNGPISLKLDGTSWNGSLEATTNNGPLSLRVPKGYHSGVLAEALGHGPVSCHAEGCAHGDDTRQIHLGSGPAVIHVATENGPLSIRER